MGEELMSRWFCWLKWFCPVRQNDINKNIEYLKIDTFINEFEPKANIDYTWVYEHAVRLYDDVSKMNRLLDSKAQNLVQYLAPSSGLIGIAIAWFNLQNNNMIYVYIPIFLGILLLLASMLHCLLVLMPHQQSTFPSVRGAIESAESYENENNKAKAMFSLGIESSIVIKCIINNVKAKYLQTAQWLFFSGFGLIILSILVILIKPLIFSFVLCLLLELA